MDPLTFLVAAILIVTNCAIGVGFLYRIERGIYLKRAKRFVKENNLIATKVTHYGDDIVFSGKLHKDVIGFVWQLRKQVLFECYELPA